ncbi:hypothetical protein BOX17_10860 [Halomonas aestuarii]|uniref:Uncharacterized protein n=1 Tax=Halomonas aestuarii TaxID=1897729 RepID=A0A1J0VHB9_9GAMM|nr:hypothetical protein BOX17_10860 [Halomonas aestuarii]
MDHGGVMFSLAIQLAGDLEMALHHGKAGVGDPRVVGRGGTVLATFTAFTAFAALGGAPAGKDGKGVGAQAAFSAFSAFSAFMVVALLTAFTTFPMMALLAAFTTFMVVALLTAFTTCLVMALLAAFSPRGVVGAGIDQQLGGGRLVFRTGSTGGIGPDGAGGPQQDARPDADPELGAGVGHGAVFLSSHE